MKVQELGHVVLYVGDVRKSAAFYHDILGWDEAIPPARAAPSPRSRGAGPTTSCS